MPRTLRLLLFLFAAVTAFAQNEFPAGVSGEFVSLEFKSGKYFRINPEGCAKRFAPFSSFKIPNSLIGLETGIIQSPDDNWHWDASKYPAPNPGPGGNYTTIWQQDNSLRTALSNSIVWYYRELATRVGEPRMKHWLSAFHYGNQDISGGLDRFWLGSSLRISPDEQVEFLAKLQRGEFPVAKKNLEIVKEILTQETTPDYRLIAKTGSSAAGEGWLVGWVESGTGGCTFALHLKAATFGEMAKLRPQLAQRFLKQAGCMPSR